MSDSYKIEIGSVKAISVKLGCKINGVRPRAFKLIVGLDGGRLLELFTPAKDHITDEAVNRIQTAKQCKVYSDDGGMAKLFLADESGIFKQISSQFVNFKNIHVPQTVTKLVKSKSTKPIKSKAIEISSTERPAPPKFDDYFKFESTNVDRETAVLNATSLLFNINQGNHSVLVSLLKPYEAIIVQVDAGGKLTSLTVDATKDDRLVHYTNYLIASRDKNQFFNQKNVFAEVALAFVCNAILHELGFKSKKNIDGTHFDRRGDVQDVDFGGMSVDVKSTYSSWGLKNYMILEPRNDTKKCELYVSVLLTGSFSEDRVGHFSLLADLNGFLHKNNFQDAILVNSNGEHIEKDGRVTTKSWVPFNKLQPTIDLISLFLTAEMRANIQ